MNDKRTMLMNAAVIAFLLLVVLILSTRLGEGGLFRLKRRSAGKA